MRYNNYNEIFFVQTFRDNEDLGFELIRAVGISLFPFLNQFYFLSFMKFLKFENFNNSIISISRSYIIPLFCTISFGFIGYLSFGPITPRILILSPKICSFNLIIFFVTIARILYLFNLLYGIGILFKSLKDLCCYLFFNTESLFKRKHNFY